MTKSIRSSYYCFANYLNRITQYHHVPSPQQLFRDTHHISHILSVNIPKHTNDIQRQPLWLPKLYKIFLEGKKENFISNIIIHGSYGDFTHTNFSDIDITLILNESIIDNKHKIIRLRNWINRKVYPFIFYVDPLQHHGPFYIWDSLLQNYSEKILPVDVYRKSWALKNITLKFQSIEKNINSKNIKHLSLITCQALNTANTTFFKHGLCMYQIKRYLSNLMLIPAFYLTDIGRPTHKSESFLFFYKKFKKISQPLIEATKMRSEWPASPWYLRYLTSQFGHSRGRSLLLLAYKNRTVKKQFEEDIRPNISQLCLQLKQELQR